MEQNKIALTFDQIETGKISKEAIADKYIQAYADKMMELSNYLVESEDDPFIDIEIMREEFLPAIREFIANTTGL